MPIATNKVPRAERRDIPHYLLDYIGLDEEPWTVGKFVKEARKIVDEIRARGKLPILVGGTHFYTQSLLFEDAVIDESWERRSVEEQEKRWPILGKSSEEMLKELQSVDPLMASKWHPKDVRKIRRSLQIWLETGQKASELYAQQRTARNKSNVVAAGGEHSRTAPFDSPRGPAEVSLGLHPPLRYDTLIFWVYRDPDVLKERLDERVDEMIDQGLLAEVEYIDAERREQGRRGASVDTTKGIWVAIGYKEFQDYLRALREGADNLRLASYKQAAVNLTKIATRQYAKQQDRWIRLKLMKALADVQAEGRMFLLERQGEATSAEALAYAITCDFLAGKPLPEPHSLSKTASVILDITKAVTQKIKNDYVRHCELCDTTVATERSWKDHLNSRKHKGLLKPRRDHRSGGQEHARATHPSDLASSTSANSINNSSVVLDFPVKGA